MARDQHVGMSDDDEFDDDDEMVVGDQELVSFEKHLFAAIRESRQLDAEIDDEYRRLTNGEYDEPAIPERESDGEGKP